MSVRSALEFSVINFLSSLYSFKCPLFKRYKISFDWISDFFFSHIRLDVSRLTIFRHIPKVYACMLVQPSNEKLATTLV